VAERAPVIEAGGFLSRGEWPRCDGFSAPGKRHDGMTKYADLFVNATPSRVTPRFGRGGIAVCDAALADPRMLPEWSLRRANILQARALHKAAVRDFSGALADLASSDAAAGTDRYTLRSMGATNNLIRSWLRMEAGEKEEAVAALRQAAAARPWEAGLHGMVLQLHLAASSDWETYRRDTRQLATLDPNRLVGLYALAMTQGDFAEAAALYPQINLTVPRDRGGYRIDNTLLRRVQQMVVGADLRGGYAYALAASGKPAEAAAEVAQARAEVERAVAPPKPIGRRTELTREQRGEHAAFSMGGEVAKKSLDRWDRLTRLKQTIGERKFEQAFVELQRAPIGADGPALDIVQSLIAIAPRPQPELEELSATMRSVIATQLDGMRRIRLTDLFEALPEPESARAVPPYDGASDGWLSFDSEGYRLDPSQVKGAHTIRFARSDGTMAMASEMVLLRAAELARKNGHRGFILAGRRMIRRELLAYGQAPGTGTPSGQEAELDVVFVDPARLPPEYANAGWRVLDAEKVWTELSPLYPPPRARSASR
jgi:tetratricopeptide (TPR) repeat protein